MNENELKQVVEKCWQAAADAKMPGMVPMIVEVGTSKQVNSWRWSIFQLLLSSQLTPHKFETVHKIEHEKEPWQE